MNHTITLTPKLNVPTPDTSPQRLSLLAVLWYKFIRWVDKATLPAMIKVTRRIIVAVSLGLLVFMPQLFIGYLTAALKWNSYRIPIFCALLATVLNAKRVWIWMRRIRLKPRRGNQHTLFGFAVSDLADLLTETQAFKREDTQKKLAMTNSQYFKVADWLEKFGIVERGESNARVLRTISREQLVLQLRAGAEGKAPPLVWDETRAGWFERDGVFNQWALKQEQREKKLEADTEKKERKLERLEKKIENTSAFQSILNMSR